MLWIICAAFLLMILSFYWKKKALHKVVIWQGECPPTTFSYRDQSGRQRITVQPIRILKSKKYIDLVAINSNGNEKIFYRQLIDSMMATEGHKKMHFDDWVNDVLLASK